MAALTIKFNYVQDYAVLYREDFIKYVGTILPKTIKRDHVNDVMLFGEIARYTDNARFGELEIEYR